MRTFVALVVAALLLGVAVQTGEAASCTAKQKRSAQGALAAYKKAMPKQRAAYFRKHKKPALRKTFVRKQQAKLKKLKTAAGCRVPPPRPPSPPPALPVTPPASPPAPRDTTPPRLMSAVVNGSAVSVRFDESVFSSNASFTVYINGAARTPLGASAGAAEVTLTLAQVVGGEDVVTLDYGGGVTDAFGNAAAPASGVVVANATPTPCNFMVGNNGLSGPGNANEGPTDAALYEPSTGVLRGIVLWVDFPDAPSNEPAPAQTSAIFQGAINAFAAMSYGRLALQITASPSWYRLPQPSTFYGLNAADGAGRKDEYIASAISAADSEINFGLYDVVYLVPAPGASADFATSTQRPVGSGFPTADGTQVRHAVLLGNEQIARNPDAVVHETGHVLGLPDLYARAHCRRWLGSDELRGHGAHGLAPVEARLARARSAPLRPGRANGGGDVDAARDRGRGQGNRRSA